MSGRTPKDIFDRASQARFVVPPYLKTRVLAEYGARSSASRPSWMRALRISAFALSLALTFLAGTRFGEHREEQLFLAQQGEPTMVHLDVQDLKARSVAEVEIDLPEGVFFHSEEHPEFNDKRHLKLAWNSNLLLDEKHLPFVIRGHARGTKKIYVRFLGPDHEVVAIRDVKIKFSDS